MNEPDWWLNPQTHLETHEGKSTRKEKTESKMRQRKRKKGRWSEYSGYFRCIHWPRLICKSDMKASDTIQGVKLPSQPSAFTHETWTMKQNQMFSSFHFVFLGTKSDWRSLFCELPDKQVKEKVQQQQQQKNAKETGHFHTLLYLHSV